MSTTPMDLVFYGCANMPTTDGVVAGGAVTFSTLVTFADMATAGTVDYVSSSASDTAATLTVTGLDSTGTSQVETKTLTGTTIVAGAQSFARLMSVVAGGTTAVGDIAAISATAVVSGTAQTGSANSTGTTPALFHLASGQGASVTEGQVIHTTGGTGPNQLARIIAITGYGTDIVAVDQNWTTVPDATTTYTVNGGALLRKLPNQITTVRRPFYDISADVPGGSARTYYEKVFAVNNNTATALTSASIIKQVDPAGGGTLEFALTTALDDTGTVANRQTAPASGITAFSTGAAPQTIAVPSPGNLPNGTAPNAAGAQGIWFSFVLPAGTAPDATSFTMRVSGQTV